MKNHRLIYLFLFLFVIFLGIFSRKIAFIPLFLGDLLYAVMIYLLIRIVLVNKKAFIIVLLSLLTCYTIELLQLYQAEWIVTLRKTLFGRYVLGQGFLWSDLVAYTAGIAIVFIIEKFTLKYNSHESSLRIKQQK